MQWRMCLTCGVGGVGVSSLCVGRNALGRIHGSPRSISCRRLCVSTSSTQGQRRRTMIIAQVHCCSLNSLHHPVCLLLLIACGYSLLAAACCSHSLLMPHRMISRLFDTDEYCLHPAADSSNDEVALPAADSSDDELAPPAVKRTKTAAPPAVKQRKTPALPTVKRRKTPAPPVPHPKIQSLPQASHPSVRVHKQH